jgi:propionyl-CoA carboxylase alpha chain
VRRRLAVALSPDPRTVDVDSALGSSSYVVVPRFTDPADAIAVGSLVAPMPGSVVRVLVEPGAAVTKGDALVVLEAMKMEHTVASPSDGTVGEVRVTAGQQVDAGSVLVVVETAESGE